MTTAEFRKKYGLGAGTEQKDAASDREKALEEWREKSVQRIVKPAATTVRPQTGVRTGFGVLMEQMSPSASPVVRTEPIISPLKSVETGGKYYSKPNLWTDAEQMKQRVAQTETNLKVLQRQAQDLAAAWQKSQTDTAYQMWQDVYNRYKSEYDAYTRYYDQYDAYLSDQQRQYDDWRGTIRSAEQVQSEMAAVKLMIDAVKKDRAKNYLTTPANQLPEYDARIKQYEEQLAMLEEEYDWARRLAYEDLQKNPDFAELSKYKRTGETAKKNPITGVLETTGYGDVEYEIINRNDAARQWQSVRDIQYGAALAGVDQRERTQMTDDEIAIFNYLYAQDEAKGDKNHTSAYEYVDYITTDLTYRQQQKDAEWWSTYAKENPVRSSVFSAVLSPMKAVSAVGQAADYLEDGKIDENAGYNKFSHIPYDIRGAVSESVEEKWGGVGSFAYNTGMSMADFLVNTALSGGSSGLAMTLMGSEIAADTVIDGKKRGLSDDQAFALGIIAGLAEAATEKFSVDALLDAAKLGKSAFGYWMKNTITEASEEGASNLINTFADVMISKDKSEWQKAIDAYKAQGLSEKEALYKAIDDQAASIGLDMLGGAISGGTMAMPGVAVQGASKVTNAIIDKRQNIDKPSADAPIRTEKWFEPEVAEDGTYEDQEGNRVLTDGTKIEKDGTKVLSTADTREQGKRMERAKTVTARTGVATGATDGQIKTAERLSKILGKEIRFFRQDAAADGSMENGLYRPENDVILVNAASEKGVRWVVAHELTHSTELSSEYDVLNKFVISQMQEMGVDVDAMVKQRQTLYAEHGVTLTDPDAKLEVVADFAADYLLTDEKTIRALVKGNPTVGQRILEWADKLAAKIRKTESEENEVEILLRKARKMYAAALADANKVRKDGTVQETERVPEKKTERETAKEPETKRVQEPEEAERDPFDEDGDDSLQEEAVDANIHEVFPDAQFSVTRTAKEQDAIMAKMRSILQNGGTAADLRSYVDTLDAQERAQAKKKPQGTNTQRRADAASQIVRAAHNADMTVEEYLRENAELYETEDGWNRDARRALEMERGGRYSISKVDTVTEEEISALKKHFGTTKNYDVAGYLLTDGSMLDFSGKHWGDDSSDYRQVDHRDVLEGLGYDGVHDGGTNGIKAMTDMIGSGNIRLMPEAGGINLAVEPTKEQIDTLVGYIRHFHGEIVVDIDAPGGDTIESFSYNRGTAPMAVIRDIMNYFEDGTVPAPQPEYRQFRYSISENAQENVHKALYDKSFHGEIKLRDVSPEIMTSQKGVSNYPMTMRMDHLRENVFTEQEALELGLPVNEHTHYHGLGEELFLKIIDGLDDVRVAYRGTKNAEKPERREKYFLLISTFKDREGNVVNVPVYTNEHSSVNRVMIDANKISTTFGRNTIYGYLQDQVRRGNLVRIKNRSIKTGESNANSARDYGDDASKESIPQTETSVKGKLSITASNTPTNALQTKIGELLGVPSYFRDKVIGERLKNIAEEYKKTGEVSEETVTKVFDEIRADAVEISADLWQGQKKTLLHMQGTPVFVDEDTRQKFDDWDAFEEKAEGILRITEDDTAVSVEKLYRDLLEIESGAFPENIRSPQKMLQNMYEFGRDVERAGRSVYWEASSNRDAMIEKNKKDFESAVSEWVRKTKDQERKAAEKKEKKREIAEKAEKRKDPVRSRRDLKRNLSALFSVPKEIVQRVESIIAPFEEKIISQGRLMEEDVQDLFNALYASGAVMEHVDGTVETGVSEETVIENLEREMRFQLRMFAEKAKLETDLRKAESVVKARMEEERAEHHAQTDLLRSENWALREQIKEERKEGAEKVRQVKQENSARWNKYLNQRREQMREQREHKKKMDLAKQLLAKYKWARTNLKKAPADVKAQLEEILEGMDTLAVMPMRESKLDEKIEEYGVTWRELPEYIKRIKENDKDFIPSKDLLDKVERVSAKKIADMDINAIGNALQVLIGLQTEFYNRKNLLIAGQFAQIDAWHDDIVAELEAAPAPNTKKVEGIWEDLMNRGQLTAVNVIRRMAGWNPESTLYKLAEMFEGAEYAMHEFEVKSREPIEEFTKKHRDWVRRADGQGKDGEWIVEKVKPLVSMKVGQAPVFGKEVEIAMTPMMRVHMLLESKNAQNLRHMAGGRVFADRELYSKGKRKEAFAQGKPVKLAPSTVKEIVSKATKEELELAEILQKYYNGYSKESVNKVTNMLYGYEKAVVKEYAPIYVDKDYTKQDPGVYDATIENIGNLKERTNSWTPSLQISAIDAFDRHVDRTARFVAYAIPVRNWTMLMKWEDEGSPMRKRIAEKWGSKATEYLDTLITEMQTGGERQEHNIIVEGLENLYSKTITAVFGLNPSVVSKQLGSLAMALPELGMENAPNPAKIAKIDRELIGKYTAELAWRASGNASVETQLMRENPNRIQRNKAVQVLTGGAITAVDQWTASVLWPWAENKVRKEYPELSVGPKEQVQAGESEFYKKVAEVFNHAVAHSQSMADQMHQSSLRKSKNPIARTFTVFKSDAAQAYNQLRQYVGEARYYDRISQNKSKNEAARKTAEAKAKEAKKRVGTAVLGIALNNAWSTMVTLLMALWKNKGKNYRDDDDELTVESVMGQMTKDFLSGISSMVVGGEEIVEVFGNLITGDPFYDIETPGVDVVNEFAKLLTESAKGAEEFFSRGVNVIKDGGDFGKFLAQNAGEVLGGLKDTAVTVSSYFGIPAGNLEAYLKGTFSWFFPGMSTAVEDFLDTPVKSDLKGLWGRALDQRVADIMADRGVKISEESAAVLAAMYDAGHNPVIPSSVPSSVTIEEVTHDLTETQKQKYAEAWAKPVSTHLEALLNSQEYKQASADDKQLMISKVYSMGTAYAKNKLFQEYKLPTWIAEVEQFDAAKMSFPQYLEVQAAYSGIYESKADGKIKALDFAKWVVEQDFTKEQQNVIRECFGDSAETYYKFVDAGVTEYNAYRTAKAISELKPTDGRESIVSVQKYRAVIDEQLPASQELLALSQVMTDSDYAKVQAGNAHGITPGVFVTFKELLPQFDADGNGSFSQEEVERAIDSIGPRTGFAAPSSAPANASNTNLTNAQRAVLWQLANKSWNPTSNPYSVWEGRKVYNDLNGK